MGFSEPKYAAISQVAKHGRTQEVLGHVFTTIDDKLAERRPSQAQGLVTE